MADVASAFQAAGSLMDNLFANYRQDKAQDFSAEQYATRYQTTVKDLNAAGLNPMLAYSNGPGSSPTSSASSAGSNFAQAGAVYNQSKVANAQAALIAAQTENQAAQGDLYRAQAAAQWASAGQSTAMIDQTKATADKIREEIKNIPLEGDRLKKAAHLLVAQSSLADQQATTEAQRWEQVKQTAHQLRLQNAITQEDLNAIIKTGSIGRLARELGPASDIAQDWLNPSKWFTNKSRSTVIKGKP